MTMIKGVNVQVIWQEALRNKDRIAFVIIMALALAMAVWTYNNQEAKTEALQEEIAKEEERISAAKELDRLDKEISNKGAAYFRGKESLDEGALRRLASLNSVKMVSFGREEGENSDFLLSDLLDLEVQGGYHNLARFVNSLESRGELLRIENLLLKNPGVLDDSSDENEDLSLVMRVRVSFLKAQ